MSPVLTGSTFIRPFLNLGYGEHHREGVNTLPELIEFSAKHNPDHIFGLQNRPGEGVPSCEITFSQLQNGVELASAWLVSIGSTTGRTSCDQTAPPVALFLGSDISIFIYMAALLRIGTPVLILSARLAPVAISHLLKETSPATVLVSTQVSRAAKETLALLKSESGDFVIPRFLDALSYEELLDPEHPILMSIDIPPVYSDYRREDLDAVILHSSGTTGLPKPIFHTQAYILAYAGCHRLPEQKDPFRFNVSTLPLYHGFGLLAPSLSLSVGLPFVLPPASVIPTGKSTLAALQSTGARSMLSVPSILEDILRLPDGIGLKALRELEFVAIGGAAMKESVGSELVAAGVNLLNHWGATELGAITPIERVPHGYDWHYLLPRTDMGLKITPLDDGSNTYHLSGQAPGWKEPFVVQDLLVASPHDNRQFKILGRADDLLILATGEKVLPAALERTVAEHPDVKDVLAFGGGQLSLGILIELVASAAHIDLDAPGDVEALVLSIEPYLQGGNSSIDKHGKIAREMIVFTRENTKPLIRTDKGSLARKENYAAFDAEIKACYDRADVLKAIPFPLCDSDEESTLLDFIRSLVQDITGNDNSDHLCEDTTDFFEAGMDSLQATRLRRAILNGLRVTKGLPHPIEDLDADFCFENSSVEKLQTAIAKIMSETYQDDKVGEVKEAQRISAMVEMVEKSRSELISYAAVAAQSRARRSQNNRESRGAIVLLTGSTGSLGCFLLARLANDPSVAKVICLNRVHSSPISAHQRQLDLMVKRSTPMSSEAWSKVVLYECKITQPDFGLNEEQFNELLHVTHIIHNAWPVNFSRNLSSFEPHVKALTNLVRLSLLSAGTRAAHCGPTRLLFASSIAVASRFPILHPNGPLEVPETALEATNAAKFGYPEAKWVCERVLVAASELYGNADPLLRTSSVRIGQMTGAEGSGAWNENEHFPIIVRTSKHMKKLPSLDGSLSWMPVNRAGNVMVELLFSEGFRAFYHMENPSRQAWSGLLSSLTSIMGDSEAPISLVPFLDWLDCVREIGDDPERNPAFKILNFLENDFVRMATGGVILGMVNARLDSPTLVKSTSLDRRHLEEYIAYWRNTRL